ncbi:helix-turn-helix domain-containing protein [Peribacillus acanthi]|uniref:helix-turn-helix domain-containing protein n=1 Tax=Peribacillus acanthi TaxID=2171554 RepID=UPI0013006E3B|nr:helix-turn-helix domain-containing protein [Peribacillus acanthi]
MSKNGDDRTVSNNFGATLKWWREKRQMSLQELFEKTGVSNGYISRLERGERKAPSVPISAKLADALGIPLSLLLDISTSDTPIDEAPLVAELVLYNDCKRDADNLFSKDEKESFIQIIEFILEMSWDEDNRIKQLFDLSELIDDFKEVSK